MIEDRRQKSRLSGRRSHIITPKARQSQETIEPRWISGQKAQTLDRYRFGGGFAELWLFGRQGPKAKFSMITISLSSMCVRY
jgi:hypothetical protein